MLDKGFGATHVAWTNYAFLCDLRDGMIDHGRSLAHVKKIFTHMHIVANYGRLIEDDASIKVAGILAGIRIQSPPKKTTAPTREQIRAIVYQALFAFATGLRFQWVFCLRAVDVRGQWLECKPDDGGIVREAPAYPLRAVAGWIAVGHIRR
jgi:hypothetical protein